MRVSSTLLLKKNHSIQLENFRYQLLYYINSCLRVIPMLTIPASRNWKSCLGTLFPTIYDFGSMQISDTVLYKWQKLQSLTFILNYPRNLWSGIKFGPPQRIFVWCLPIFFPLSKMSNDRPWNKYQKLWFCMSDFLIYNLLKKSKSVLGGITKIYHAVSWHCLGKQIHFHNFEVWVWSSEKGTGRALVRQVQSWEKEPGQTLVWSLSLEFSEGTGPYPGLAGQRKERAKPYFGRFGIHRKNLAEPWFWVQR